MALTSTTYGKSQAAGVLDSITSNALTVSTGQFIDVIEVAGDNASETAWTVTNTGTAITWTNQQETNTASNCRIVHFTGIAGAVAPATITVQATAGVATNGAKALIVIVHAGQHATTPLPAGNLFLIASGTDRSQAITPTSTGSNLWMVGADWNQTNSFAAGTNNTLDITPIDVSGEMTVALVRPTTQPRADTNSFTLSLLDTGGKVIAIAFEVQAEAVAGDEEEALTGSASTSAQGTTAPNFQIPL